MGIPESPSARGACPTDEELAAFLDGMLPAEERARITAHLADCESCYEIFAGAVHFQQDEQDSGGTKEQVGTKEGRIVPFPVKQESNARRWNPWWIGSAAAAVLVLGLGFAVYKELNVEPDLRLASLAGRLPPVAANEYYPYRTKRGGGEDQVDFASERAAQFMVGVLLLDDSHDRHKTGTINPDRLRMAAQKLGNLTTFSDPSKNILAVAQDLESGEPRKRAAERLSRLEAEVDNDLSYSLLYRFGKWTEAGRLATVAKRSDFFARRENLRFFANLMKEPAVQQDEDIAEPLAKIKTILDRGARDEDSSVLAAQLKELIQHYDI